MNNQPIGLFDSGIGGTSIWKELLRILPCEHTIYLADSQNSPYGEKSAEAITARCIKNTEWLLERGCKLIVVACNTATTNAIDYLRAHYKVPFIGIEPAIKPAALQSKTGAVGILATRGTLSSKLFEKTTREYTRNIKVIEQDGEGLVSLIEAGKLGSPELDALLLKYLQPMLQFHIGHPVLGCTHYPYLIPAIRNIVGKHVAIIDSGEAVARQTKVMLEKHGIKADRSSAKMPIFYTNGDTKPLMNILAKGSIPHTVHTIDF